MLNDRTYLLFKPRQNLPNDRLHIRNDSSYGNTSLINSYRSNPLTHSSSYERLSLKSYSTSPSSSYSTTPLPTRKYATSLNSHYDYSSDFNAPRRRTATFGSQNGYYSAYDRSKPALQRSDSFGSTIGLYPEKSGNMEKREMLMSSFNRHTNTSDSNKWLNRLKLKNLFSTPSSSQRSSILPPRPASSNYYNSSSYGKSYSPYKANSYRVNYLNYDDYFRPRIRERPLFSDIRKSVMHKNGLNQYKPNSRLNYSNNYTNKFNKSSGQTYKNSSVLSNGSSGLSRSSSSSGDGSISYTQQSTETTSPSETQIFNSQLQSQKSIRKVDRYRSVIKFQEHNIGKSYADRKDQINWEIDADDPFGNNDLILNKLVDNNLVNEIVDQSKYDKSLNELNNLNKEIENVWNVITDTTILTHTSSTNTLADLNVGYEAGPDNEISKLEQQFAEIKRRNEELEKLKVAFEQDNLLSTGRRKLHKSVNLKGDKDSQLSLNKKSKSVKICNNVKVRDVQANDLVEEIAKVNEKVSKLDDKLLDVKLNGEIGEDADDKKTGKVKRILKTSKTLTKKPSKVRIKDENEKDEVKESKDLNNNLVNKDDDKFKNKTQAFKTLFVKPEVHVVHCKQAVKKTDYFKPEIFSTNATSLLVKTDYKRLELEKVEKKTKLIKTDYKRLELESITKLSPLIRTEFEKPKTYSTIIVLKPSKTDYQSPKLVVYKLTSPLVKTDYHKLVIHIVELKSDLIKTDYSRLTLYKTKSTRLPHPKTSYYQPEIMIAQATSPLYKTDYYKLKLEQVVLKLPLIKTNYERLEWFVTKPIQSSLFKTDYQSPKLVIQIVELKLKPIKTDYISFPIQTVTKHLDHLKTEYFRVPIQIVELKLSNIKTDYFKVPIQEVHLKLDYFSTLDYEYPARPEPADQINNQTTGKPPLNLSAKNQQLNRSSRKSTLNNLNQLTSSLKSESSIGSAIKNTLLSFSSSSNELKRLDSKESVDESGKGDEAVKKKVKKVKKVKVAKKASSVSGSSSNNENKIPEIVQSDILTNGQRDEVFECKSNDNYLKVDKRPLTRSVSLDQNEQQSNYNNYANTFQNATASREQYRLPQKKRIIFRKYKIEDFYLQSVLGRGSFGKVFLAELIGHDVFFAIKCLKKNVVIEDNDVESTMIERKVLALGSTNPFICKLFCTFQTESYLCFAMEYLAGGDLMYHVQKNGRFTEDRARFYAAEIVCALKFLHRRYIIYRDLKLDNVLLDQQGHIRLVDFGMCQCKIYRQEQLPSNFCGTPDYMAPEIVKGVKYNNSVDYWSFGVLLYEMLIGKSPFTGADEDELLWNVCNEKIIFPLFLSKEAVHIIALLLNRNPDKRLGMPGCPAGDITQQQFFDIINWQFADNKLLPPPFIPDLAAPNDISNFDKEFTEAEPALTPVDETIINDLNHELFEGFDYTNPHLVD